MTQYNPYSTKYPVLKNAYGFLRSNWNLNPSPYISRYSPVRWPMANCYHFQQLLAEASVTGFTNHAPYLPHGSIHVNIGGIFGCELLKSLVARQHIIGEHNLHRVSVNWSFQIKELYRKMIITFPDRCKYSLLTPKNVSCKYRCQLNYEQVTDNLLTLK